MLHRLVGSWMAVLTAAAPAAAQCDGRWLPGEGVPGVGGTVYATTVWDPDGAGPEPELLVVGGVFRTAGEASVNHVAAWDGAAWRDLGGGVGADVYALAVHDGRLIAGGRFTSAGGQAASNVAAWDGTSWAALGSDVGESVSALGVHGGELFASVDLWGSGGVYASRLVRWNGSAWDQVGLTAGGMVRGLSSFAGELVACGLFESVDGVACNRIARWDGTAWRPLGTGLDGDPPRNVEVNALAVHEGALVVAGKFSIAGGQPAARVASWDGASWSPVGEGVGGTHTSAFAQALAVYDGDLIVAGYLLSDGGVARWNGSGWETVGAGVRDVNVLAVHGGDLVAAGASHLRAGDDVAGRGVLRWNGSEWRSLGAGFTDEVRTAGHFGGDLVIGGTFWRAENGSARYFARWDGLRWHAVGADGWTGWVEAIGEYGGDLVAGGSITSLGGGVARWNGSSWEFLGGGLGGNDIFATVRAMVEHDGELVAGGRFTAAGGAPVSNIAAWDGSQWRALGSGLFAGAGGYPDVVLTFAVYNGDLIAGGAFVTAGGQTANRVARWDGQAWHPLGSGLEGPEGSRVHQLVVFEGAMIAAGSFQTAGGAPAQNIARWDGASWSAFAQGIGPVTELAVVDGRLFAASGSAVHRWDGNAWEVVSTLDGGALTLTESHGELIAGGWFTTGDEPVRAYFQRWTDTGVPWVARHPQPAAAPPGGSVVFEATAASGYEGLLYRWRRDGVDLADGPTGSGSVISGAATAELAITNLGLADRAQYDCVISSACGSVTSEAAALTVECAADMDDDGVLTLADFVAFRNLYVAGDLVADFDGSGDLTLNDFVQFRNAYVAGCR